MMRSGSDLAKPKVAMWRGATTVSSRRAVCAACSGLMDEDIRVKMECMAIGSKHGDLGGSRVTVQVVRPRTLRPLRPLGFPRGRA